MPAIQIYVRNAVDNSIAQTGIAIVTEPQLYIGLMSGTSLDSIDAALVSFDITGLSLLATHSLALPLELKAQILTLNSPGANEIEQLAELDPQLGRYFAEAVNQLLNKSGTDKQQITAIGSHGQTLRHRPEKGYSLQIGDPNVIAEQTGITTVADFRRRDLAAGGQGAPLVPAFHRHCFHSKQHDRVIVNIGGMANLTLLPADTHAEVIGYDTGPGNVLIDSWALQHTGNPFDLNGEWAASGKQLPGLLNYYLEEAFFTAPHPKSTGRELFNFDWIIKQINRLDYQPKPEDVQHTLTELTAITLAREIQQHRQDSVEVFLCGGGSHNCFLRQRLSDHLEIQVQTTQALGLDPDWVEACAFAWLAHRTLNKQSGNLMAVTGAAGERVLGGIYIA